MPKRNKELLLEDIRSALGRIERYKIIARPLRRAPDVALRTATPTS